MTLTVKGLMMMMMMMTNCRTTLCKHWPEHKYSGTPPVRLSWKSRKSRCKWGVVLDEGFIHMEIWKALDKVVLRRGGLSPGVSLLLLFFLVNASLCMHLFFFISAGLAWCQPPLLRKTANTIHHRQSDLECWPWGSVANGDGWVVVTSTDADLVWLNLCWWSEVQQVTH